MSLVETTLKKLQQSARQGQGAAVPHAGQDPARKPAPPPVPAPPAVLRRISPQLAVVEVDREALRAAGLMPPESQERQVADQFRQIKRTLIGNATGRAGNKVPNGNLIMTASALPNEGKTFTSINLAMSLALDKDIEVLLVDADVAKPHISRIFGVEREAGLLDALKDDTIDVESLVIPTNIPRLNVLPAGTRTDVATELLSSTHMQATAARLAGRNPHRIILLDSPPLLLTTESRALTAVVGQVVIVVCAGVTPQQAVLDAVSHVPQDKTMGFILNQVNVRTSEGYYYGDGSYGQPVAAAESADKSQARESGR
jgi:exopolysaccharide/PEP-CTERM locus tyrosine autokinase